MKNNIESKNRFKILKGGKVSLVLSSLLISSSLVSVANASPCEVSIATQKTTTQNLCRMQLNGDELLIRNTGSIITTNSPAITAISLVEYNTIFNEGTIRASKSDITGGALNTILVELQDSTHKLNLTNKGTIEAKIDEKLHSFAFALKLTNPGGGTINVYNESSGVIRGNVNVQGTLINQGVVELPYNAANSAIAKIKKFDNYSDGILRVGFNTDGTKDNTSYSKLLSDTAIFYDNSAIDVNVLDSSTNVGNLVAGTRFEDVVKATTNLKIDGKLKITDNSSLIDFKYVTSDGWINEQAGAIHLEVVKNDKTILSETTSGGGNQNSKNAAIALQGVYDNNPEVANAFNTLSSDTQIARAVESTTPAATNASIGAGSQISNGISTIVSQRQNANISGSGGLNSGDGMFSENNFWIKPFASFGKQGDKNNINGFDLKTYGLGLGVDTEYKDNQSVGLALFYTNGKVDTNSVNQTADLDVFTGLLYGNVPIIDDKTNLLYQAGYSVQRTDTKRDVFTGQTAEAKYNSKIASIDLKLQRDVNISDDFLLQPLVSTTYRHFKNPSYSESGAGALNLNVDKFKSSEFIVGVGTLAHYKLTDSQKIVGNVNVGYDLKGDNNTVTSSFMGASGTKFGTDGIDNGRWSYQAGIGYELDINKRNNINISYDYQGEGTKFSNNVISAKYVLKF